MRSDGMASSDGLAGPAGLTAGGGLRPIAAVATAAVVAGIALGAVDLLAQRMLPYPWANLANSSAVWALAAFAIGVWVRRGTGRCAAAGVVLLVVAVVAYFGAAVLFLNDAPATLTSPATVLWLAFGVGAGCVFGVAGHLRAARGAWPAVVGAALPVAVLLAEAALRAARHPGGWNDDTQTAVIEVALAVVVAVLAGRGTRGRALAFVVALPLAALGWAAFRVTGFA